MQGASGLRGIWHGLRRAGVAAALSAVLAPAVAAPVQGGDLAPGAYELALQWTLAYATPTSRDAAPAPAATATGTGHGLPPQVSGAPAGSVPDPGGYALMGLALLAAGLLVQRITRRGPAQRGLSKKT